MHICTSACEQISVWMCEGSCLGSAHQPLVVFNPLTSLQELMFLNICPFIPKVPELENMFVQFLAFSLAFSSSDSPMEALSTLWS